MAKPGRRRGRGLRPLIRSGLALPRKLERALDSDSLRDLLVAVRSGDVEVESAVDRLARLPFLDTAQAHIDTHRALRQGIPEVVYGAQKSVEQIVDIARALRAEGQDVLVTRVEAEQARAVKKKYAA